MDVALLGCGCSAATEAVAEVVQYWSLPQVCIITVCPCCIINHFQVPLFLLQGMWGKHCCVVLVCVCVCLGGGGLRETKKKVK